MFFRSKKKAWWEGLDFIGIQDMEVPGMISRAVISNHYGPVPSLYSTYHHSFVDCKADVIQKVLTEAGATPLLVNFKDHAEGLYGIYAWEDGAIRFNLDEDGTFGFYIATRREGLIQEMKDRFAPLEKPTPTRGFVYAVVATRGEFSTMCLGQVKGEIKKSNYPEAVCAGFDYLLKEICDPQPSGRLTLLTGEPGTGKSHFLRGVMAQTDASFLLIPPNMVGSLTGPDLIGLLSDVEHGGLPVVLVLEDSDAALIQREKGTMSAISDLLNLADGIVGELLNIRILATTNAKEIEMDRAVIRPGRLSQVIQFPLLTPAHANEVLKELTQGKAGFTFEQPVALAEIYYKAHGIVGAEVDTTHIEQVGGRRQAYINNRSEPAAGMYM